MKTILTAGLLVLASSMAAAAPIYPGSTRGSPNAPMRSQPHETAGGAGHVVGAMSASGLTSLDQFEMGDPDESASMGSKGAGWHARSVGHAPTSLAQFEMGDPDVSPGG